MKKLVIFAMMALMLAPCIALAAPDFGFNYAGNLGLGNADPRDAVVSLIKVVMTFLGIIAVVVILFGGFKWMTAAGNEDKVAEARKLIVAGVIGLIIILSAWAITTFVINQMSNVVT
ncbi:hypothetical protein KAU19_01935 [Candidatus Parcubacteria bacterium]|nr:hypothetical protein [Candidatus Parcubacteria bacterium]